MKRNAFIFKGKIQSGRSILSGFLFSFYVSKFINHCNEFSFYIFDSFAEYIANFPLSLFNDAFKMGRFIMRARERERDRECTFQSFSASIYKIQNCWFEIEVAYWKCSREQRAGTWNQSAVCATRWHVCQMMFIIIRKKMVTLLNLYCTSIYMDARRFTRIISISEKMFALK